MATKRKPTRVKQKRRIAVLDELRGFAIVLMVFYHAFYLIGYTFNAEFCRTLFHFFYPVQPLIIPCLQQTPDGISIGRFVILLGWFVKARRR